MCDDHPSSKKQRRGGATASSVDALPSVQLQCAEGPAADGGVDGSVLVDVDGSAVALMGLLRETAEVEHEGAPVAVPHPRSAIEDLLHVLRAAAAGSATPDDDSDGAAVPGGFGLPTDRQRLIGMLLAADFLA